MVVELSAARVDIVLEISVSSMLTKKLSTGAALILGFSCLFSVHDVMAQHADSGGQGQAFWQLLKTPISLPDIPQYSGQAQFVSGLMYPNKPGGPTVSLQYRAREAPDTVITWYEEALKAYKWVGRRAPQNSTGGRVYEASKGKSSITVTAADSRVRGFLTEFKISCKVSR